jgi:flagellar biosynthesis/type III secretory pathway M-ring protein FliF/YscJ
MAKKRKTAAKTAAKKPSKATAPSKPAKSHKFTHDDQITALVIAVAIVIVFIALYLYQNAKPKAALLDGGPAVTTIMPA